MKAGHVALRQYIHDYVLVLATSPVHDGHYMGKRIMLCQQHGRFFIHIDQKVPVGCSTNGYADLEMAVDHYNNYVRE